MEFPDFCRAHGLVVDGPLVSGRWVRTPTVDKPRSHRNGAYKYLGEVGWCQNHATMTEVAMWSHDVSSGPIRIQKTVSDEQEWARKVAAMKKARAYWKNAVQFSGHPYIEQKRLSILGTSGLRESSSGSLLVPVMRDGWMISIQAIHATGEKRFWPGAPVKGGWFLIDRPGAAVTCVVEGLATGLAVFQCVRFARVLVAFDAGNLLPAMRSFKVSGSVVIAADNDHGTMARKGFNPGLRSAQEAAKETGAGVAYPEGIMGTDWADFLIENGHEAARKVERLIQAGVQYVAL